MKNKLKITFIYNFLNPHTLPLALAMNKREDVDFSFVVTQKQPEERARMGFEEMNDIYDFVIKEYENNEDTVYKLMEESDVVVAGGCPDKYIRKRMESNKLTFYHSERLYKKGIIRRFLPTAYKFVKDKYLQFKSNNFFVLCASYLTSYDLSLWGFPEEKCLKWGYFVDSKADKTADKENDKTIILWVARFVALKHPEYMVYLAKALKERNVDAVIKMIGDGELLEDIRKLKEQEKLDNLTLCGQLYYKDIYSIMADSDILAFTSDKREGWGAVVNEAMSNGMVPVVSESVGSAAYLIKQGINGYTFKNKEEMVSEVIRLIEDKNKYREMSENAKEYIEKVWNGETAVDRLMTFIDNYLRGRIVYSDEGPCSKAEVIKEK